MTDRIDILLDEHRRVGELIARVFEGTDRLFAIGVSALGVAFAAVAVRGEPETLAFVPVPLGLIIAFALQRYADATLHGGYKSAVEREINRELGASTVIWESVLAPNRHHARGPWLSNVAIGLIYVLSVLGGLVVLVAGEHWWFLPPYVLLVGLTSASIRVSWAEMRHGYRETKRVAEEVFNA
jgi:hypothetical protein